MTKPIYQMRLDNGYWADANIEGHYYANHDQSLSKRIVYSSEDYKALQKENEQLLLHLKMLRSAIHKAGRAATISITQAQHEVITIQPDLWEAVKRGAA